MTKPPNLRLAHTCKTCQYFNKYTVCNKYTIQLAVWRPEICDSYEEGDQWIWKKEE
jgi:hypothetical protein